MPSVWLTLCALPSPKVISSKDVPRNDFRMYDAVPEDQGSTLPPMDPEMDKFLPMLQDYLTCTRPSSRARGEKLTISPL